MVQIILSHFLPFLPFSFLLLINDLFLFLIAHAKSTCKLAPQELFGRYQQHLVYRDDVGDDREREEPDNEGNPQSVEVDGQRKDDGE